MGALDIDRLVTDNGRCIPGLDNPALLDKVVLLRNEMGADNGSSSSTSR